MKILVTGGTGYIGSHTVVELQNQGHEVEILDNLFNSKITVLDKIKEITGKFPVFYQIDLLDYPKLHDLFAGTKYDAVIAATDNDEENMEKYDIRPLDGKIKFGGLSGGNQQKVVVARELERENKLCSLSVEADAGTTLGYPVYTSF